jgi:energy-coupling factor transport system substrate-specific component
MASVQMLAASWVGMGAGLLPPARGRREIVLLAAYGAGSAFLYGMLLNLWFWPFTTGADTQLSYVAGAPVVENLHRFILFTLATSTWGWDMGRAITHDAIVGTRSGRALILRRSAPARVQRRCRSPGGCVVTRSRSAELRARRG